MSHWYDQKGDSQYQIQKADKSGLRDTTLRDARKFNWVPSVTTLTNILAKPQLDIWKQEQVLEAVLKKGMPEDDLLNDSWKKEVLLLSRELSEKAAKRGTEIHDKLENYFLSGKIVDIDRTIVESVKGFLQCSFTGVEKWIPEQSFAHPTGFGGKVDLYGLYKASPIIVDFKTKAKDKLDNSLVYDDYCIQLAAYRLGLNLPKAECYNLIISTTKPGEVYLHPWTEAELERGLDIFKTMLQLWKLLNKYDSSFIKETTNAN